MTFEALEEQIQQLNRININANYTARERYGKLYGSIYESLLVLESEGEIVVEPGTKGLSYLRELLINDGPEYSYSIEFWKKGDGTRRYRIGVCIRGLPICKPME